jgi:cell division protein FtsB
LEFVFDNDENQDGMQDDLNFASPINAGLSQSSSSSTRRAGRRSMPQSFSDIEFNEPVKRSRKRTTGPKVNYVKPVKKKRKTAGASRGFEWSWTKLGWAVCGVLVLRMFFMESGVIDYYSMNQTLEAQENELQLLRQNNAELVGEIHKIKTSRSYQKKLARDHLGVIAKDEYLVLFSRESVISSSI